MDIPWYKNPELLKGSKTGLNYPFTGEELLRIEKKQMNLKFPKAKLFVSSEDLLYWILPVTIDLGTRKTKYTFMLRYDSNHPNPKDWGGSCKTIFLSPTVEELHQRANAKRGRGAPHILPLPGTTGEYYLDAISKDEQTNMMRTGNVQSAAAVAARAIRYAYMFEIGMDDLDVWQELCKG